MRRAILFAVALAVAGATGPSAAAAVPDVVVRYSFDGSFPLADMSGHGHDLSPLARHGGSFATVARADGRALVFPEPCHEEPCPLIALRAPTAEELNPGRRDFRFGASVRLATDQTSKGENVLQKGYSLEGSQYKLQIDGEDGRPSCVLVDNRRPEIHIALSEVSVADDRWHTLECRRVGTSLLLLVDDVRRGNTSIPADLTVRNQIPLSVGGKGSFPNNDQFQGTLDEVWVAIA